jgi:L-lactate dehydrogenase complex protein LldG
MSVARDEILSRIRGALRDVPADERPDDIAIARGYRTRDRTDSAARLDRFAERVSDYRADVRRVDADGITAAISQACVEQGLTRVVVPGALPGEWRPDGVEVVEDRGLSAHDLDGIDGAVTGCAVAIAETGTLVLDGQATCGRRIITLVPDHYICVVRSEQVVGLVPEAVAALRSAVTEQGSPITFISGPSASSDIELQRVEGVHGPRHLIVFLLAP